MHCLEYIVTLLNVAGSMPHLCALLGTFHLSTKQEKATNHEARVVYDQ